MSWNWNLLEAARPLLRNFFFREEFLDKYTVARKYSNASVLIIKMDRTLYILWGVYTNIKDMNLIRIG